MKKTLIIILALIGCFAYGQDTLWNLPAFPESGITTTELRWSVPHSVSISDSIDYRVEIDSLFIEYENQLGTYEQPIRCDCWPCAAYCYELIGVEPDYYDFKKWYKAREE